MAKGDLAVEQHHDAERIAGLRSEGRFEDNKRAPVRTFHIVGHDGFDQLGAVTEGPSENDGELARELEGVVVLVLGHDDLDDEQAQTS